MKEKWPLILFPICLALALYGWIARQSASAATPRFGCNPTTLTVRTGQTFYLTVAVTDTLDLYAWQFDASYSNQYLEFVTLLPGNQLRADGARDYFVAPTVAPGSSTNEVRLAAATRLSQHGGADGSGPVAHLLFRALNRKPDGSTVTLNDITLVDRNALEISRELVDSGRCKVIISDSAPILYQPPVGELVFVPLVVR